MGTQGNIVIAPDYYDGSIIVIINGAEVDVGRITFSQISSVASNLLPIYGGIVYTDQGGNLTAIQITGIDSTGKGTFNTLWSGSIGTGISNNYVQQIDGQTFVVYDPNLGQLIFATTVGGVQGLRTITLKDADGLVTTHPFTVSGTTVILPVSASQIDAYSLTSTTNDPLWSAKNLPSPPGTPVVYNGNVYYADTDGAFRALDLGTGVQSWFTQVIAGIGLQPLFIEDGVAYVCQPIGNLNAIDLSSQGVNTVNYQFKTPSLIVGVENGVAMVLNDTGGALTGIDMGGQIHGFSVDSCLMADNYVAGSSGNVQGDSPVYRTTVTLLDPNKNPRAFKSVRIEASDTVTLISDGQTYSLDNGGSVWLTTDASGTLNFVSTAVDVSSPALYLWGTFMDPSESIVIFPDHYTLNTLATKQASDYQTGKGFDGTPLMPASNANSSQNAAQLAQTVQGVLGGGSVVSPSSNPYSAYPASASNVGYASATAGSTTRPFQPGKSASFTTTIDASGNVSYSTGVSATQGQLVGLNLDDFKQDIVKAGKKIAKIAVKVADDVEHEITALSGDVYTFTVHAIEDAIAVVTALFNSVLTGLTKAVEFLSSLFDWGAIQANHTLIKNAVTNFQTTVRTYLNSDAAAAQKAIHSFLLEAEGSITKSIADLNTAIGNQSLQSRQQNGNDPKTLYGSQGQAQANTGSSKFKDNRSGVTTLSNGPAGPLAFSDITTLISNWKKTIPAALAPLGDDFRNAISDFTNGLSKLTTDPTTFITHSFGDLFTLLGDVAVLMLKSLDLLVEVVIGSIADILDTGVNWATGNIQVPVVSEIFKLVFKQELTWLDLAAWIIAIPATIAQKFASSLQSGLVGQSDFQLIGWAVASVFGGIWDALTDYTGVGGEDPIAIIDWITALCAFGLGYQHFGSSAATFYWAFGAVPIVISILNTVVALSGEEEVAAGFNALTYFLNAYYGIVNSGVLTVYATAQPANFSDPDHLTLCENIFSNVGYLCKVFYAGARPVTVLTDAICPTTSAFLGIAAANA